MNTYELRLLGAVQIYRNGKPIPGLRSRKAVALLADLATQPQPIPRLHLADLFWPKQTEERAFANLRWVLNHISHHLPGCICADRHHARFELPSNYWLDTATLARALERRSVAAREEAAALYRGEFMAGFLLKGCPEFDIWLTGQREFWRAQATSVLADLVAHHAEAGAYAEALSAARRSLELAPWQEEAHRQLINLLALDGQRSAALAQYNVCRRILVQELGVQPSPETTRLFHQIREGDWAVPLAANGRRKFENNRVHHNLPRPLTSFVGREQELALIAQRLQDPCCGLLTLTGPGGVGKTRLAIEAARQNLHWFGDGAYFVPLASVSTADALAPAIADSIGLRFHGKGEPAAQLFAFLQDKELLLLIDNYEHLLPNIELLLNILAATSAVRLLVTSRERLNVHGEWLLPLEGLTYPPDNKGNSRGNYSAVQLFLHTALRVRPDFSPAQQQEREIARICRLVEGVPLAIEIAAGMLQTYSCQQIAVEIERNFGFLSTSLRGVPERQRSLRTVLEHSWRLLTGEERIVESLSVFRGKFSADAARQVTGASDTVLGALVRKSFLSVDSSGCYVLHELMRQFAEEKLQRRPAQQYAIERRHGTYYLRLLQCQAEYLKGPQQKETLEQLTQEFDNIRAAWQWALAHQKAELIGSCVEALYIYYDMCSLLLEGKQTFARAAAVLRRMRAGNDARPEVHTALAKVLTREAMCTFRLDQLETARILVEEALEILSTHQERREVAYACYVLGYIYGVMEDMQAQSERCLHRALALLEEVDDKWVTARVLNALGYVYGREGDWERARQQQETALAIAQELDDVREIAHIYDYLGHSHHSLQDYRGARRLHSESLSIFRELGIEWGMAEALVYAANNALALGDFTAAKELSQESLGIFEKLGIYWGMSNALANLGFVAATEANYAAARQALLSSLEVGQRGSANTPIAAIHLHLSFITCVLGEYQDARQHLLTALEAASARLEWRDALINIAPALFGESHSEKVSELLGLIVTQSHLEEETRVKARTLQSEIEEMQK